LLFNDFDYGFFEEALSKYRYLSELSEDTLWTHYEGALKLVVNRPFDDFTQEHRDSFLRLKLCSINKML
jgi:hypothetical protein